MDHKKLSKESAVRALEHAVFRIREDTVGMNIGESMKSFPDMTPKQKEIILALVQLRHSVFVATTKMNQKIKTLERTLK